MKQNIFNHTWLQIFTIGLLLFLVSEVIFIVTGSLIFFLIVVYIGAFLVPITFVAYFYEYVRDRDISKRLLTTCFFVGGSIGLIAASLLESRAFSGLDITSLLMVALIEESAKLIFPILMLIGWKYRHQADGLLFGVAAGMGFAALETVGYATTYCAQSEGDIGVLQQVLIIRGLTSPAGHAAWTGFLCAILWNQRQRKGSPFKPAVFGALLLAIILHWTWNLVNTLDTQTATQFSLYVIAWSVIIMVSLALLIWRFQKARHSALDTTHNPN